MHWLKKRVVWCGKIPAMRDWKHPIHMLILLKVDHRTILSSNSSYSYSRWYDILRTIDDKIKEIIMQYKKSNSHLNSKISSTTTIQGWSCAGVTHCFCRATHDKSWSKKSGAEKPHVYCLDASENRGERIENFCIPRDGINQPVGFFSSANYAICQLLPNILQRQIVFILKYHFLSFHFFTKGNKLRENKFLSLFFSLNPSVNHHFLKFGGREIWSKKITKWQIRPWNWGPSTN